MLEGDLAAQGDGHRDRLGRSGQRAPGLHEFEQVAQVEVVLVHARKAAQDALDGALDRLRRGGVERQVAERQAAEDRLQRHIQVGDGGGDRAQRAPEEADRVAPRDQPALAPVEGAGDQVVAVDEVMTEAEELDLLGEAVGGHELNQVVHAPQQT